MRVASPNNNIAHAPLPEVWSKGQTSEKTILDDEPKDKVSTGRGSDGANMAKLAISGLGGMALLPCAYASLAGGAVVGGMAGVAVSPVLSAMPVLGSLTDGGIGGAIQTAIHGAGLMGHAGLVIGGATALVGAFAVSGKIANTAGRWMGVPDSDKKDNDINWNNLATKAAGTVLISTGVGAGAVGGLALGAGASAAATLVSGLVREGFHTAAMASVGSNALLYGSIGAVIAGGVGLIGGAALTKGVARHIIDPATTAIKNGVNKENATTVTGALNGAAPAAKGMLESTVAAVKKLPAADLGLGLANMAVATASIFAGGESMQIVNGVMGGGNVLTGLINLGSSVDDPTVSKRMKIGRAVSHFVSGAGNIMAATGGVPAMIAVPLIGVGLVTRVLTEVEYQKAGGR